MAAATIHIRIPPPALVSVSVSTTRWRSRAALAYVNNNNPSNSNCIRSRFTTPDTNRNRSGGWRRSASPAHFKAGSPTSVPMRVALELLQAGHLYLDVRSREEFSAGHVEGAINVPYLLRVGAGISKNPHFIAQVSTHFDKDDEILIGCQSGNRSILAATELLSAGYTGIMDIAGGYDAWIQTHLTNS